MTMSPPLAFSAEVDTVLPLLEKLPEALIVTLPASPAPGNVPVLLLEITAPFVRFTDPAFAVMLPALPVLLALVVMMPLFSVKLGVEMPMVPALPPVCEELAMAPPLETTMEFPVIAIFPALPVRLLGSSEKNSGRRAEVLIWLPLVTVAVLAVFSCTLPAFPCPSVLAEMLEPVSTVID